MIKARDKIYNEAHDNNKRREHERGLAKHRAREIAKKKREERRNKMRRQSVATKKGEKDFSFNDVYNGISINEPGIVFVVRYLFEKSIGSNCTSVAKRKKSGFNFALT